MLFPLLPEATGLLEFRFCTQGVVSGADLSAISPIPGHFDFQIAADRHHPGLPLLTNQPQGLFRILRTSSADPHPVQGFLQAQLRRFKLVFNAQPGLAGNFLSGS